MARRTDRSASKRHTSSNSSNSSPSPNGSVFSNSAGRNATNSKTRRQSKVQERRERDAIALWRYPITTLQYFLQELLVNLKIYSIKLWSYKKWVIFVLSLVAFALATCTIEGPHQPFIERARKKLWWCLYWIGLGILSSVGLGTGLHTFLLYLGPHIASVTTAAYVCKSLKFPEPPYPDEIICPDDAEDEAAISIFKIMSKVQLEAVMWGVGTALGELPPYFMAKASRLSGHDPDDDDNIAEFEQLLQQRRSHTEDMSALDRAKLVVENLVERLGFFGILACASIPNPLFDLAGITCGHFLVPFWTFFGATLIGKAIIKMHIQKLCVIIAFNEIHVETLVAKIKYIPYVGKYLHAPFKEFLIKQKAKLHRKHGVALHQEESWLAWVFEKFVFAMIVYFVLSIVNSMARSYHKRLCKRRRENSISKYNKVSAD